MPTIQLSVARGAALDQAAGGNITEATGGGAPTGIVDVNIATGTSREEALKALDIAKLKLIQSANLP